jgi:hypothetical protein
MERERGERERERERERELNRHLYIFSLEYLEWRREDFYFMLRWLYSNSPHLEFQEVLLSFDVV